MDAGDYFSSSDSSITFEGGSEDEERVNDDIAISSNDRALNTLRIHIIKALIDILFDGLVFDDSLKRQLHEKFVGFLGSLNIVPPKIEHPLISDVTNQVRQYLERLMIDLLKKVPKEPSIGADSDMSVQTILDEKEKIKLRYSLKDISLPSKYKKDFVDMGKLGEGGFGSVSKAKKVSDGNVYALKRIQLLDDEMELCVREVGQMTSLNHQNVVRYFYSWTEFDIPETPEKDDENSSSSSESSSISSAAQKLNSWKKNNSGLMNVFLYIQMELCNETLRDWLDRRMDHREFSESDNKQMVRQILEGVQYLHDQNILHRDLKPPNILINHVSTPSKFVAKITDFGLSRKLIRPCTVCEESDKISESFEAMTIGVGTFPYQSPEQKKESSYNFKSDIYCVGLMAYEIYWPMSTDFEKVKCFKDLEKPLISKEFADQNKMLSDFVLLLTRKQPSERPTASEALLDCCFDHSRTMEVIELRSSIREKNEELKAATKEVTELRQMLEVAEKEIEDLKALLHSHS